MRVCFTGELQCQYGGQMISRELAEELATKARAWLSWTQSPRSSIYLYWPTRTHSRTSQEGPTIWHSDHARIRSLEGYRRERCNEREICSRVKSPCLTKRCRPNRRGIRRFRRWKAHWCPATVVRSAVSATSWVSESSPCTRCHEWASSSEARGTSSGRSFPASARYRAIHHSVLTSSFSTTST